MQVDIAYGRSGVTVELPDGRVDVVTPLETEAPANTAGLLEEVLRGPVADLAALPLEPHQSVVIAVCDHTRPQPRQVMVEALLAALPPVADNQVTILIATGTHRPSRPEELLHMLGANIMKRFAVVNHECEMSPTVDFGVVSGDVPVHINQAWVDADLRISTGFVEPHFFAGFSGGPKLVTPGLAALPTVQALHSAARIGHDRATWGIRHGNPVHDAVREAAALAPPHLAFDVVLNRHHEVVAGFAGELDAMHDAACQHAAEVAMREVGELYDIVITSNAGYPLDQNLYQAVKGMTAAVRIVKPGGLIISVAECSDGVPHGSVFAQQVGRGLDANTLLAEVHAADPPQPEQWQAQVLAGIRNRARVGIYSAGISAAEAQAAGLEVVADIGDTVRQELQSLGDDARVCVLPDGPETIPVLSEPPPS
jgi:nickel-dependent lactate racemase